MYKEFNWQWYHDGDNPLVASWTDGFVFEFDKDLTLAEFDEILADHFEEQEDEN